MRFEKGYKCKDLAVIQILKDQQHSYAKTFCVIFLNLFVLSAHAIQSNSVKYLAVGPCRIERLANDEDFRYKDRDLELFC